ncbi:L-serine ammonia-lyase [Salinisphaera sp. LB1]|uniref:L-serine ammonia-lyase n=1 Tax=Salinisphaera sp. LB1 TaxID=2183911 RepID=UPI000D7076D0|nr:L-serine ammonia-lyase [Salinisphaera sp. LB1]AWN15124.1 L-serine dehydratase [Salinisphaera sp. LB1]
MAVSIFELFKIGIGPSSSHTVGPMRAARLFAEGLAESNTLDQVADVRVELYGSLAATGRGHGTDKAVMLGLEGEEPETVDVETIESRVAAIKDSGRLALAGRHTVGFHNRRELIMNKRKSLPAHPNGMHFIAYSRAGDTLSERTFFSVGGGFVVEPDDHSGEARIVEDTTPQHYPFSTADELLAYCQRDDIAISDVMFANELAWRDEAEIRAELLRIWSVMKRCIQQGCDREGFLPGGMKVRRRAARLYADLQARAEQDDPLDIMDWVTLYALAVNEENASGGRVVTAPTNGAAGIVPAVLNYLVEFRNGSDDDIARFLLTAAAIGVLYKENASISGAEVGCQGEVGVACSMAAGALAECLGGTPGQVENAAEIGMEHNLGLTCDPIGGLVQVPCIERNAMGAVKAIHAARMALRGDGEHFVSLDKVIATMRATGADMKTKYKETSRGGLAVNVIEC